MTFEYSAGGVVIKEGRVLIVRVRNLEGRMLWTFPKGRLEEGETAREAALREVEEETGWRCLITGVLPTVRYAFRRGGRLVRKTVRWYLMEPTARIGKPDAEEVLGVLWASFSRARGRLVYPGDFTLMDRVAPGPASIKKR